MAQHTEENPLPEAPPRNLSRIVVERMGSKRQGRYHDRIRIDPFSAKYQSKERRKPQVKA